jgi:hypothetical protein
MEDSEPTETTEAEEETGIYLSVEELKTMRADIQIKESTINDLSALVKKMMGEISVLRKVEETIDKLAAISTGKHKESVSDINGSNLCGRKNPVFTRESALSIIDRKLPQ